MPINPKCLKLTLYIYCSFLDHLGQQTANRLICKLNLKLSPTSRTTSALSITCLPSSVVSCLLFTMLFRNLYLQRLHSALRDGAVEGIYGSGCF
jgi:hypothetical protein